MNLWVMFQLVGFSLWGGRAETIKDWIRNQTLRSEAQHTKDGNGGVVEAHAHTTWFRCNRPINLPKTLMKLGGFELPSTSHPLCYGGIFSLPLQYFLLLHGRRSFILLLKRGYT